MLHGPVRCMKSQNTFLNFTHLPLLSSLCFRFGITYRNRINTIRCRMRQRDILCRLGTHKLSTLCVHVATWRFSLGRWVLPSPLEWVPQRSVCRCTHRAKEEEGLKGVFSFSVLQLKLAFNANMCFVCFPF